MRGLVGAGLIALLCHAAPACADSYIRDPKLHTLSDKELWQLAVRSSEVVLLGRILAPIAPPDTVHIEGVLGNLQGPVFALRLRIEPIEYLKGGLDGDLIDARYRFGGLYNRDPSTVTSLAGVDTVGGIFFLTQEKQEWLLTTIWPPHPPNGKPSESILLAWEMQEGFVPVPQRKWAETTGQVRAWIREMPPDSSRIKP